MADASSCTCKDIFQTEIQAIIQINEGVLTSDNKAILEALPLLDHKGLVKILFNLMTEKQDACDTHLSMEDCVSLHRRSWLLL